eukprot:UN05744
MKSIQGTVLKCVKGHSTKWTEASFECPLKETYGCAPLKYASWAKHAYSHCARGQVPHGSTIKANNSGAVCGGCDTIFMTRLTWERHDDSCQNKRANMIRGQTKLPKFAREKSESD